MKFYMTPWQLFKSREDFEEWYMEQTQNFREDINWGTVPVKEIDTADLKPGFYVSVSDGTGQGAVNCGLGVEDGGKIGLGFSEPMYDSELYSVYAGENISTHEFNSVAEFEAYLNLPSPAEMLIAEENTLAEAHERAMAEADVALAEASEALREAEKL
ncbi:MAG: hypothetical protein WC459_02630 [Patescibacteria group bacterium]